MRTSAVESLAAAKAAQEALNEESITRGAQLAAAQAQKLLKEAVAAYMGRVDAENEGMWKWEQQTVRSQGYSVSGEGISRQAVVDATVWGVTQQRQAVHRYEPFRTEAPRRG